MPYDPRNPADRKTLAAAVEKVLLDAEFVKEYNKDKLTNEWVYFRGINDTVRVRVFTSIVDGLDGPEVACPVERSRRRRPLLLFL